MYLFSELTTTKLQEKPLFFFDCIYIDGDM